MRTFVLIIHGGLHGINQTGWCRSWR